MNIYINAIIIICVICLGFVIGKNKAKEKKSSVLNKELIMAPKSYRVVSVVLMICHIISTIIGFKFSVDSTEDTVFIIALVMLPLFISILLLSLWFNLKKVELNNDTLEYTNLFGVKKEYILEDLSLSVSKEKIKVYHGESNVFNISFLWENIQSLIDELPIRIPKR